MVRKRKFVVNMTIGEEVIKRLLFYFGFFSFSYYYGH